jgi:hypothetical protein
MFKQNLPSCDLLQNLHRSTSGMLVEMCNFAALQVSVISVVLWNISGIKNVNFVTIVVIIKQ